MTLSREAKQALKYVQSYLDNDANKGYGSHWDYDVECAREEGEKAGRKAGIKANQIATAKKMLSKGMNLELTAEITGLSIKILEKLNSNK